MVTDLEVDDRGLAFRPPADDLHAVADVLVDGRRIWSIRPADGTPLPGAPGRVLVPWPRGLRPYLSGRTTVQLRLRGDEAGPEVRVRLGGSDGPLVLADRYGRGLTVNKWGKLGRSLADYDAGIAGRLLDRLDRIRELLAAGTDVEQYVTGGTLLGPWRDGRLIPYDDDVDLAYLSPHAHPADVVLEALRVGRVLAAAGLTVKRLSAGHVQLPFEHEGRPDGYVDVFTGWIDERGWWHQVFALRHPARRDQLVPPGTVDVEGRPEPAPRDPELMLEAIYGPGWRTPDPSFTFAVPRSTGDRFWGWVGDQNMDREQWESCYELSPVAEAGPPAAGPSGFARAVVEQLPAGTRVVELGCGAGEDALWLASRGHPVEAVDYALPPLRWAAERAADHDLPVTFGALNLYDPRGVVRFGARVAAAGEPVAVYARGLLGALWDVGRPNLFRLLSMLLRSGGRAHLDVPLTTTVAEPGDLPLDRAVEVERLAAEMMRYGLRVESVTEDPGIAAPTGAGDPPTARMVITWERRAR